MKWNWGTKIAIAFAGFCGLMIFMAIKSFEEDFHLVTDDYYQAELAYQDHIDRVNNAKAIDYRPEFEGDAETVSVTFELESSPSGIIHFYRPENAGLDRSYEISGKSTIVSKKDLVMGRYIVKINWTYDETQYFSEQDVIITK